MKLNWNDQNSIRINGIILFILILIESEFGSDLIGHAHTLQTMALHIGGAIIMIVFTSFNLIVSIYSSSRRNDLVSGVVMLATIGATFSGIIYVLYNNQIALSLMEFTFTLIIIIGSILLIIWGTDRKRNTINKML